jgi:hypothetical protein
MALTTEDCRRFIVDLLQSDIETYGEVPDIPCYYNTNYWKRFEKTKLTGGPVGEPCIPDEVNWGLYQQIGMPCYGHTRRIFVHRLPRELTEEEDSYRDVCISVITDEETSEFIAWAIASD